ncbi:hypothetical protein [Streptomyces sp. NPDC052494]|uniref:hypothetical protein n=1 Tax=Streptomyces sp. NPDC052494 TaxID=3365692 RepID=UPI0037D7E8B2
MQMSEPFATTVAAVAPVIWVVGAVEFHQVLKRMRESADQRAEQLRLGVLALRAETDLEAAERLFAELRRIRPLRQRLPSFLPYTLWYFLTLALVWATVGALEWLAEDGGPGGESGEAPFLARAMVSILAFGFATITLFPMVMVMQPLREAKRQRAAARVEMFQVIEHRRALVCQEFTHVHAGGVEGEQVASPPS